MKIEHPSPQWSDYEIVDSGNFEKLERFGRYFLSRPEPKALWDKSMTDKEWDAMTHTRFRPGAGFGKAGKEDSGTWERLKPMKEQWFIDYGAGGPQFRLRLGLTSFKHVGVFPEQASNWEYIHSNTKSMVAAAKAEAAETGKPYQAPKILNLFAYTGAASLAAKAAGADVTHLDSVRAVVTWAHENQDASSLDGIRWIVDDAMKYASRQARRGTRFDGIILDPPAYGHGPDGEKWKLDECLFGLLKEIADILAPRRSFMVLNLYSNGYSAILGETLVRQAFGLEDNGKGYELESGELVLRDRFSKLLPLSIFVRLKRN